MQSNDKQKRIKLSIQMPSVALLRFIEKALQDDEFFASAIENPLGAMKESGVRLNLTTLTPRDLATFFGALAGVKELIKKRQIKDITFEKIFGQVADIRGTILAETQRGMWTQFTRDAQIEKAMFITSKLNFETLQEAFREAFANIFQDSRLERGVLATANRDLRNLSLRDLSNVAQVRLEIDMAGNIEATETTKGSDVGTTFHFDADKGVGSQRQSSIDTYKSTNFSGVSFIEQILNGPLINPADLINISAQMETYIKIAEQVEEF
jgi:hypothetical protein